MFRSVLYPNVLTVEQRGEIQQNEEAQEEEGDMQEEEQNGEGNEEEEVEGERVDRLGLFILLMVMFCSMCKSCTLSFKSHIHAYIIK